MRESSFGENGLVNCGDVAEVEDHLLKSARTETANLECSEYSLFETPSKFVNNVGSEA